MTPNRLPVNDWTNGQPSSQTFRAAICHLSLTVTLFIQGIRLCLMLFALALSSCQAREARFTEQRSIDGTELSVYRNGKLVYYRLDDNVERFYIDGVLLATKTQDGFFTTEHFSGRLNYVHPKPHRPAHIWFGHKGVFQTFEQNDGEYY